MCNHIPLCPFMLKILHATVAIIAENLSYSAMGVDYSNKELSLSYCLLTTTALHTVKIYI